MKRAVKVVTEWQTGDGESVWGMIQGQEKMFWKNVRRVRKGEQGKG